MSVYRECQHQETPESSACGYYREAGMHVPIAECEKLLRKGECDKPWEHHEFVPRADLNGNLTDGQVATVIDALELVQDHAPSRMVANYRLSLPDIIDLHDRLLAYMDNKRGVS